MSDQTDFSAERIAVVRMCVEEMFEAIPKKRRLEYIGHLNDTELFLNAAQRHINAEADTQPKKGE